MNSYKLLFDWQISMPDNWQGEYDKESGLVHFFYPDNSDLTIRITPFHAERDGILARKRSNGRCLYQNSASICKTAKFRFLHSKRI